MNEYDSDDLGSRGLGFGHPHNKALHGIWYLYVGYFLFCLSKPDSRLTYINTSQVLKTCVSYNYMSLVSSFLAGLQE